MPMGKPKSKRPEIPERFRVARSTLWFDHFMNYFITMGGIGIIVAVSLIFVFILIQIIPLFQGASVRDEDRQFALPDESIVAFASDEWSELPYFVTDNGEIHCLDIVNPDHPDNRGWFSLGETVPENSTVSAIRHNQQTNEVIIGLDGGQFIVHKVNYSATYPEGGGQQIVAELESFTALRIGPADSSFLDIAYGDSGTRKLAAAIMETPDGQTLRAVTLNQQRSLFGSGEITVGEEYDLTPMLQGNPVEVMVPWEADSILLRYADGRIAYLFDNDGEFVQRQVFQPFAGYPDRNVSAMNFILGDVSVVFTNPDGEMVVWSLYRDSVSDQRIYGLSKQFPSLSNSSTFYSKSLRNKAFLTGHRERASLRFLTTENIRWERNDLPFTIRDAVLAPRYNRILFLDNENNLHYFTLEDPHPSAGWKSYFSKIRYEGQEEATYTWQSTGGRDDFEPKLSMIPLLVGTFKGTIYAMLFAVPIALMAAIYTSQFLYPDIKRYIKPIMEIMASLPSVVLGFLAALWLAPIVSNAVPSVILCALGIVFGTMGFGWAWTRLPNRIRLRFRPGWEFCFLIPAAALMGWLGWSLGPVSEHLFFNVAHPETGLKVPSFQLWYQEFFNLSFEQRNAFVVGFVMGFAVIPIIFTISEDALTNVPEAFRSGSLALGASRWQTAVRIVLPTASAGIFSALMIGLGRAVGETMIVVMATGNVATTELNPFTGMRTLSANIAVELPEAPYLGTLYRSLFLGAMLLFLLTFAVNTMAEIMRQKLRERYRAVE